MQMMECMCLPVMHQVARLRLDIQTTRRNVMNCLNLVGKQRIVIWHAETSDSSLPLRISSLTSMDKKKLAAACCLRLRRRRRRRRRRVVPLLCFLIAPRVSMPAALHDHDSI